MSKLTDNERIKLSATYLNGVAVALMTAGVLAPLIGVLSAANLAKPLQLSAVVVSCMLLSGGLHLVARMLLRGLVE